MLRTPTSFDNAKCLRVFSSWHAYKTGKKTLQGTQASKNDQVQATGAMRKDHSKINRSPSGSRIAQQLQTVLALLEIAALGFVQQLAASLHVSDSLFNR